MIVAKKSLSRESSFYLNDYRVLADDKYNTYFVPAPLADWLKGGTPDGINPDVLLASYPPLPKDQLPPIPDDVKKNFHADKVVRQRSVPDLMQDSQLSRNLDYNATGTNRFGIGERDKIMVKNGQVAKNFNTDYGKQQKPNHKFVKNSGEQTQLSHQHHPQLNTLRANLHRLNDFWDQSSRTLQKESKSFVLREDLEARKRRLEAERKYHRRKQQFLTQEDINDEIPTEYSQFDNLTHIVKDEQTEITSPSWENEPTYSYKNNEEVNFGGQTYGNNKVSRSAPFVEDAVQQTFVEASRPLQLKLRRSSLPIRSDVGSNIQLQKLLRKLQERQDSYWKSRSHQPSILSNPATSIKGISRRISDHFFTQAIPSDTQIYSNDLKRPTVDHNSTSSLRESSSEWIEGLKAQSPSIVESISTLTPVEATTMDSSSTTSLDAQTTMKNGETLTPTTDSAIIEAATITATDSTPTTSSEKTFLIKRTIKEKIPIRPDTDLSQFGIKSDIGAEHQTVAQLPHHEAVDALGSNTDNVLGSAFLIHTARGVVPIQLTPLTNGIPHTPRNDADDIHVVSDEQPRHVQYDASGLTNFNRLINKNAIDFTGIKKLPFTVHLLPKSVFLPGNVQVLQSELKQTDTNNAQAVPFYLISLPRTQTVKTPSPFVQFQSPANVGAFSVIPEKVNELEKNQQWKRSLQQPLSIHLDSTTSKSASPTPPVSQPFSLPTYSLPFTLNTVSIPFYRPIQNSIFPIPYGLQNSVNSPAVFIPQHSRTSEEKSFLIPQFNDQNKQFIVGLQPSPKNSQFQNYATKSLEAPFLSQIQQPVTTIAPQTTTVSQPEEPSTLTIQKVENNGLLESTLEVSETILNQTSSRIFNNAGDHLKSAASPKRMRNYRRKNLKRRKRLPLHSVRPANKAKVNVVREEANAHFDSNNLAGPFLVSNRETIPVEIVNNEASVIPKIIDFNMIRGYGKIKKPEEFHQFHQINLRQEIPRDTFRGIEDLNERRQRMSDNDISLYKTLNIEPSQAKQNDISKQQASLLNYLGMIHDSTTTVKDNIKKQEDITPQPRFLLPDDVISLPPPDVIQQNAILHPYFRASSFANQQQGLTSTPQRYLLVEQPVTSETAQSVSRVFLGSDGRLFAFPKQENINKIDISQSGTNSTETAKSANNTNVDINEQESPKKIFGPGRTVSETFTKEGEYLIRTRVEEYVAKDLPEEFRNNTNSNNESGNLKEDGLTNKDITSTNDLAEETSTKNVTLATVSPTTTENFATETVAAEKEESSTSPLTTILTPSEAPQVSSLPLINVSPPQLTTTELPVNLKISASYGSHSLADRFQAPSFLEGSFVPNHIVVKPVLLPNGQIQFVIPHSSTETSSQPHRSFPEFAHSIK
uniref:PEHE domain-containing protein n=1 Tax=Heterorhabditis bacteriophora TaxID=37862 RepID=A0A1I7XUN5_HETBA